MNKYAAIKINAFQDELEKLGVVGQISRLLLQKALPAMLRFGRSATTMAKGTGVTHNMFRWLEKSREAGLGARATYKDIVRRSARKWGTERTNLANVSISRAGNNLANAPQVRAGIGKFEVGKLRGAVSTTGAPEKFRNVKFFSDPINFAKTRPKKWIGEAATNLQHISSKGLGNFMKHTWKDTQLFERNGFKYARTPVGKVTGPLMSTAVGFPAISFALGGKDPTTGQRVGLVKRTARAAGEAAAWSIAPGAAMASITPGIIKDVGEMAKSFI